MRSNPKFYIDTCILSVMSNILFRISVDAVLGIAMGNEVYAPSNSPLTRQAMLALGGMSKSLRETDPELANEIIDTLHGLLDQQIGNANELLYMIWYISPYVDTFAIRQ